MAAAGRGLMLFAAVAAATGVAAVCLAPAALVDGQVARRTDGALRVASAEGTLWRGRGVLVGGGARVPLVWRVDAWPLLRGELRMRLAPPDGTADVLPRADIAAADGRVDLRSVDATIPAALLAGAAGSPRGWSVAGDVRIATPVLEWTLTTVRGDAGLQWRGARLVLADGVAPLDLGDVQAVLTAAGDRLAGPVSNAGGDLALRGELALRASDGLRLSLALTPRRPVDAGLARLLATIAVPGGEGWRIDWRTPLR